MWDLLLSLGVLGLVIAGGFAVLLIRDIGDEVLEVEADSVDEGGHLLDNLGAETKPRS